MDTTSHVGLCRNVNYLSKWCVVVTRAKQKKWKLGKIMWILTNRWFFDNLKNKHHWKKDFSWRCLIWPIKTCKFKMMSLRRRQWPLPGNVSSKAYSHIKPLCPIKKPSPLLPTIHSYVVDLTGNNVTQSTPTNSSDIDLTGENSQQLAWSCHPSASAQCQAPLQWQHITHCSSLAKMQCQALLG